MLELYTKKIKKKLYYIIRNTMVYSQYLTSKEKDFFEKSKKIFGELLDDFYRKGLLRKNTPHEQRKSLYL